MGMSWWQGILTVLIGNVITLVPMVLNGHPGEGRSIASGPPASCSLSASATKQPQAPSTASRFPSWHVVPSVSWAATSLR